MYMSFTSGIGWAGVCESSDGKSGGSNEFSDPVNKRELIYY